MFRWSWCRLIISKVSAESYVDYLQNSDRELPALSEIFPRHGTGTGELVKFHSLLCEAMKDHNFNYVGIKVVPPTSPPLQCLRATEPVCVPIFSNSFQGSVFSAKQHRIQFVEPLFVIRLGRDPPTQLTANTVPAVCDAFFPGVEFVGSRYPFYPPHTTGFAADLGGCVAVHLGEAVSLGSASLESLGDTNFVVTRREEPIQVGAGKNCLGGPGAAVALAVSYAASMGWPLREKHYIFCSGVGSRSPALAGEYKVNYGAYGSVSASLT
ncbi:uncharacterized protein TEOVI_000426600 [Trypanosoma equiperdum]|uniref:REH2-associated factor 2 n=3 Tax=Trypanozoon TaxID=39700 RepID=H2F2_TRYB2|nr:hypothetical protein, conserved [Trypanosoma brucei brucei TREU927]Q584U2.1 RecName: Full=REH2-associated factor 2; Flags: Precursor [Trypanosoma brucei brucei TREU927]AAX80847.1 hypothetical protein, conserved [Trypanosoma brucei]RHW71923.1 hypothetical protein DPX39_060024500 [Trypanosoma brucei equiperdum]SCU72688.1 hypothetical protein, conserved [Trypanosoma equiperdum]AAZ11776.1 hypothetical protein, conserved [Trypanosoma brucei brucei TREU927]